MLEVEGQPSGLGWLPDGDLLVVSMKDRRVLRRSADGSVAVHADVSALTSGHLNDMIVDAQGHAFAGNFGFDLMGGGHPATAGLVRIDPDGSASAVAEDLWFPNGMVITDDGTLIVAETLAARFTAFTIQDDGALADRHIWAEVEPAPEPADTETMLGAVTFAPDGCALDAEGHVWAANALGGALSRVAPGGRDRRRDRDAGRPRRLRVRARRRGRTHAGRLRGTRLRRGGAVGGPRGGAAHDHRRRPARGPALIRWR